MKNDIPQGNTTWFKHDRFGLFIHWGVYSLPARGEWVQSKERLSKAAYQKYYDHFNPDLFEPERWADAAKKAGIKYVVATAKHHDGFCLWDTQLTDYKATNTPYRKDCLSPIINAFKERNIKTGLYYSLYDWHHPDYVIDYPHPLRFHDQALAMNKERSMSRYCNYFHGQTKELLTLYKNIDIMWFDMSFKACEHELKQGFKGKGKNDWQSEKLIRMIRDIRPEIIINNRLDIVQDIVTPEQYMPNQDVCIDGVPVTWESCQTLNGAWGYSPQTTDWRSPEQLIQLLINAVSHGGNLLMNIAPSGRGDLDEQTLKSLDIYATWMKKHSRSIYGCGKSDFIPPNGCAYTQKGKKLYLHVFNWPFKHLHLKDLAGKLDYAQMLHDASEIKFSEKNQEQANGNTAFSPQEGSAVLHLPVRKSNVTVPVIELFLK